MMKFTSCADKVFECPCDGKPCDRKRTLNEWEKKHRGELLTWLCGELWVSRKEDAGEDELEHLPACPRALWNKQRGSYGD